MEEDVVLSYRPPRNTPHAVGEKPEGQEAFPFQNTNEILRGLPGNRVSQGTSLFCLRGLDFVLTIVAGTQIVAVASPT